MIQGSLGEHIYTVGSAAFPTLDVSQDQVEEVFEKCRLEVIGWTVSKKESSHYFALLQKVESWTTLEVVWTFWRFGDFLHVLSGILIQVEQVQSGGERLKNLRVLERVSSVSSSSSLSKKLWSWTGKTIWIFFAIKSSVINPKFNQVKRNLKHLSFSFQINKVWFSHHGGLRSGKLKN